MEKHKLLLLYFYFHFHQVHKLETNFLFFCDLDLFCTPFTTHKNTMQDDTILTRLEKWSAATPDKLCYTFVSGSKGNPIEASYTYKQLDDKTTQLAKCICGTKAQNGWEIAKGSRVLLVYTPSLDFIVAYLACLRAGVVAVPVFPPIPGQLKKDLHHFASIHESSGATVALTNTAYNFAKRMDGIKQIFSSSKTKWPTDIRWIVTDKKLPTASVSKDIVLPISTTIDRTSLAFLQYTSGSTSEPKGVMISHNNLAHNLSTICSALKVSQETICVAWLPQYHDMGLIGSYLGTLYCGGIGYYMSPVSFVRRPVFWIEMMSTYKATHTQAPNFAYKLAARKFNALKKEKRDVIELDLSSLEHMFNAAEPVTPDALLDFNETFSKYGLPKDVIIPGYGLAEHTVYVTDRGKQKLYVKRDVLLNEQRIEVVNDDEDGDGDGGGGGGVGDGEDNNTQLIIGCGVPTKERGIDVRIVNKVTCEEMNENQVGEIWVNSPSKAEGYFGKEELSKKVFFAKLVVNEIVETEEKDAKEETEGTEGTEGKEGKEGKEGTKSGNVTEGKEGATTTEEKNVEDASEGKEEKKEEKEAKGASTDQVNFPSSSTTSTTSTATYLRTGDLGFIHNNELFICGRDKDLIIIRGKNHYPQDIEKTIEDYRDDQIRGGCTAAFSVTTSGNGPGSCEEESLIVVAEIRDPKTVSKYEPNGAVGYANDISKKITTDHGVNVYKVLLVKPRSIDKTSSGKIARQWVRKAYLGGKLVIVGESGSVAMNNGNNGNEGTEGKEGKGETKTNKEKNGTKGEKDDELNITLKRMVAEHSEGALEPSSINMNESLITLGLGSMQVVQFSGQVSSDFDVEIDEELIFQEDTTLKTIKNIILKSQGKEIEIVETENNVTTTTGETKNGETGAKVAPMEITKKKTARKKGPSTFQVVFCFCCRGGNGTSPEDQKKAALQQRVAEDDF